MWSVFFCPKMTLAQFPNTSGFLVFQDFEYNVMLCSIYYTYDRTVITELYIVVN